MSSFVPFYEMLVHPPGAPVGTIIVTAETIRARFDALIAGPNGNDLDKVRHQLKSDFRGNILTYLTNSDTLPAQASHQRLMAITSGLNSSDKGNIAEAWYRATYAPNSAGHVRFIDTVGRDRVPDIYHLDNGTLRDIKYIAGELTPEERIQYTQYRGRIRQDVSYKNASGARTRGIVERLEYSFFNPDGVLANSSWMHDQFSVIDDRSPFISFEIFDRMGQNYIVTSAGIFRPPPAIPLASATPILPVDSLLDASAMRDFIAGIRTTP